VGKSTTAVSLGASLAELGHRVLVVDLDPQGNASTGLGIRHEERDVTVYDVLADEAPIEGAVVPTPIENLFAIPSTIDLAGAEIELVSQFSRELRLKKAIEPLRQDSYDFVFLDCPPSLGLLTVNALAAAEELIVPIQCEYYALEGLGQLLRNVRLVQQNVNTGLRLTGIVMTMFDPRTKLSEQVVAEVRRFFGDRVYQTIIPRTVRLSEAPGFGQPITVYDPHSKGAQSYRDLAREVAARLPDERPLPDVDDVPSVVVPPLEPQPTRAPRPLVGPDDQGSPGEEPDTRFEGGEEAPAPMPSVPEMELEDEIGTDAAETPEPAAPHPDAEPDAKRLQTPGVEPRSGPAPVDDRVGREPDGDGAATTFEVEPAGSETAGGERGPDVGPTLNEPSRAEAASVAGMNGDQAQPEREDEMQLGPGATNPSEGTKRRRGLFRRGGS
jgi:chromosome partitioning protein